MESLESLSDGEILARLGRLVRAEKRLAAEISRHLAEVDRRELYRDERFPSLFAYCVQGLGLSEPEAQLRIHAARATAQHPGLLQMLEEGQTTLSAVARLAPVLTEENRDKLLDDARGKSCREVERLVAAVRPLPARADVARKVSPRGDRTSFVAAERVRIALDASAEFHEKLERARALLRHRFPSGNYEDVLGLALDLLLEREDPERRHRRRKARSLPDSTPRASPDRRAIPAALGDAVWARDGGRCAYIGRKGRCPARECLEIDHIVPWAMGGKTTLENLRLLCRSHNQHSARQAFGSANVARAIELRREKARLRLDTS